MKIQEVAQAASLSATAVKEWSGAAVAIGALILAVFSYLGVGIVLPWDGIGARAASLETKYADQQQTIQRQQGQIDAVIQQSQQQGCIAWQLMRDRYSADLKSAQDELNTSPTSPTLQRARDEARDHVGQMNAKLNAPPCS